MSARIPAPIPVPIFPGLNDHTRIINENFRRLSAILERAIQSGDIIVDGSVTLAMLAAEAKTLVGDVTGTIDANTVGKIQGKAIAAPAAGDDGKAITYDHAGLALAWTSVFTSPLTTRGDLLYRDASAAARLGVGGANTVLKSDGTDPSWASISSLLDALFSSTQGAVLYRGAAAWQALAIGTSGHFLKSQGAGADPVWAAAGGGGVTSPLTTKGDVWGFSTVDDRIPVGTNGQVLTADSTAALGLKWASAGGSNALLDGSAHSDTLAGTVVRGDLVVGNGTPLWSRKALGGAGKVLKSDAVDPDWKFQRSLRHDRSTPVMAYASAVGNVVNNGGMAMSAGGGSMAAGGDTERPCTKWTTSANTGTGGFGQWTKHISGAMSPCMTADFKIVAASKMNLQIGFNDGGFTANSDLSNTVVFAWQMGTDTNFMLEHNDATSTITRTDTGVAKDAAWHDIMLYSPDAGTTWILEIDGVQTNSITTEIPAASTLLVPGALFGCNGASSTGEELRQSYVVVQIRHPMGS